MSHGKVRAPGLPAPRPSPHAKAAEATHAPPPYFSLSHTSSHPLPKNTAATAEAPPMGRASEAVSSSDKYAVVGEFEFGLTEEGECFLWLADRARGGHSSRSPLPCLSPPTPSFTLHSPEIGGVQMLVEEGRWYTCNRLEVRHIREESYFFPSWRDPRPPTPLSPPSLSSSRTPPGQRRRDHRPRPRPRPQVRGRLLRRHPVPGGRDG